jgi:hypothetical protein
MCRESELQEESLRGQTASEGVRSARGYGQDVLGAESDRSLRVIRRVISSANKAFRIGPSASARPSMYVCQRFYHESSFFSLWLPHV